MAIELQCENGMLDTIGGGGVELTIYMLLNCDQENEYNRHPYDRWVICIPYQKSTIEYCRRVPPFHSLSMLVY